MARKRYSDEDYDFSEISAVMKHSFHWTSLAPQACV